MELDAVRQTFIAEAEENLHDMETALLALENSGGDNDLAKNNNLINTIFRAAHTIKGSAGVVGFEDIEGFSHVVENLMEHIREGTIKIDGQITEILLACCDHLSSLSDQAADDSAIPPQLAQNGRNLVDKLNHYLSLLDTPCHSRSHAERGNEGRDEGRQSETENYHISLRFGEAVLRDGMDPISFINYLMKLGTIVSVTTIVDTIPSLIEMDPESCYLGFEIGFKSDFDKETIENVFEFVKEDCKIRIIPPKSLIDSYIWHIRELPEDSLLIGEILVKGGALTYAELEEALHLQREGASPDGHRRIGEIVVEEKMAIPQVVDAALGKQEYNRKLKAKEAKFIRVDAGKLDHLINMVGELVISAANLKQHAYRLADNGIQESTLTISTLIEEIREAAMGARMVPIEEIFSRFHRVVRDISHDTDKDIHLFISGGETELDRGVVEKISDPLMHLIRNAAGHGIESSEKRTNNGKSPKGTIRLSAYQEAGNIIIEVSDDGKGLDKDKIMERAVQKGVTAAGQTLSDNEMLGLIFEPGFSTAEQVTKISGRGVGMDVVKKNIEMIRGRVDIESKKDVGTTVKICLPLTLAIIDGFMVEVGGAFYVIPQDMVIECTELSEADRLVSNNRHYVNLRGQLLPYIKLGEFFNCMDVSVKHENIVVVQYDGGQKIGFVVDELLGEMQAVVKSIGKIFKGAEGISGATILGDGTVALIIDVAGLMQAVGRRVQGTGDRVQDNCPSDTPL